MIELCGVGRCAPDTATCGYEARYDEAKRSLFLTLDMEAAQGATLVWNSVQQAPAPDWRELADRLLIGAGIAYDTKDAVSRMAKECETPESFLAQLHTFDLPQPLYGAMLELFLMH